MKFPFPKRGGRRGPGPLALLYDEAQLPNDIRRGLNWILAGNTFGTMHGIICGGGTTALVGLAAALGAGDTVFGLMVIIPQIAAILQLPFSMLVNHTRKRKFYLLTYGLLSRMVWLFMGFLPLVSRGPGDQAPIWLMAILLALSSAGNSLITVVWFPWFSDMAPIRIRGRWLSLRDTILSVASLLFGFAVAYLLDVLPQSSKYIVVFLVGGLLGCLDMLSFSFSPEVWASEPKKINLVGTVREVLENKRFMKMVIMWTAWCFTANMSGAYLTPYAMNVMGLSFMQITIFGTVAASLATVLAVPRWGAALDQFGARNVMLVGCIGASLTPLFYLLSTPGNIWPTFLHNAVGALFWSAANLACNGMQLAYSPDDTRPTYIAVYTCIAAIIGTALGTASGSWMLEVCRTRGWFEGYFDRYKMLVLVSVVLRFGFTILLVPRMDDDGKGTVKDMLRSFRPKRRMII